MIVSTSTENVLYITSDYIYVHRTCTLYNAYLCDVDSYDGFNTFFLGLYCAYNLIYTLACVCQLGLHLSNVIINVGYN